VESKQQGPGLYFWEDVTTDDEGNETRTRKLETHVVVGERPKVDGGDEIRDLPLATEYVEPKLEEGEAAATGA